MGRIGSAVLNLIEHKQTSKHPDKQSTYKDRYILFSLEFIYCRAWNKLVGWKYKRMNDYTPHQYKYIIYIYLYIWTYFLFISLPFSSSWHPWLCLKPVLNFLWLVVIPDIYFRTFSSSSIVMKGITVELIVRIISMRFANMFTLPNMIYGLYSSTILRRELNVN